MVEGEEGDVENMEAAAKHRCLAPNGKPLGAAWLLSGTNRRNVEEAGMSTQG